ncbi:hypothetical protein AB0J72_47690 [Dactylosporangium sp. NPDC049742]|uniref:hypothetical protein n=1 Tax=Dactylosporangium sp. NPDC049742 TaxID=3154737 RepID=UPI00341E614E
MDTDGRVVGADTARRVPPLAGVAPRADLVRGRGGDAGDPGGGDDLLVAGSAVVEDELADAGEVAGGGVDAAERLLDAVRLVEVPGGGVFGADGLPDAFGEQVGQRVQLVNSVRWL